jgi:hypothetical protein
MGNVLEKNPSENPFFQGRSNENPFSQENKKHKINSEEEPFKKKKEQTNLVPPYDIGMYDLGFNLEGIDSREDMIKYINHTTFLIDQVDLMNEYAEIYCINPSEINKLNLVSHLIPFAQACASFRLSVFDKVLKVYNTEKERVYLEKLALYGLFYMTVETENTMKRLSIISEECVDLIRSLYYVEQKDNPPYPPAPPPIEGFPLAPVEGYYTMLSSEEIYEMLRDFTNKTMPMSSLPQYLEGHQADIIDAFNRIRSRNTKTNNMFVFNVDPVFLKDELIKKIPNEHGEVMYIINGFEMFIVYGNFIVDDTDPRLVTGLHPDEVINLSEKASTAYLSLFMHGSLLIKPGEYRRHPKYNEKHLIALRARKEIKDATEVLPEGMRIFIQKQAEPFEATLQPNAFKTFQPGTASYRTGICDDACKDGECHCFDAIEETEFIGRVSTELNEQLRKGYLPSIAHLEETYNLCKETSIKKAILDERVPPAVFDPMMFIYKPGNKAIREEMQTKQFRVPRKRDSIGRIPLSTTKYINKRYTIDPMMGAFGIYNLLNGLLISATKDFTDYIDNLHTPHATTRTLRKIRRKNFSFFDKKQREDIPHSPRYLNECYLSDIIGYFKTLGYRNIYFFEFSCESARSKTETGAVIRSTGITDIGLGVSRRKRKTRKHSNKSRRYRRSNGRRTSSHSRKKK